MTSQEMMKTQAKPGNVWVNIAPLGEPPDWREVKSPHGPHSDPNYGIGKLFGYDAKEFMRKQYK